MSAGTAPIRDGSHRGRWTLLVATAASVAGIDLAAKAWAQRSMPPGGIETGPVDLRLAYNSGVAFSAGADAPAGLVLTVTAVITTTVAVLAWRATRRGSRTHLAAIALVLGGAVANLVDRAGDGVVTDYLYTGWWPTFNLADTAIVTGGVLLVMSSWRRDSSDEPAVSHADPEAPGRASPTSDEPSPGNFSG